MTEPLQSPPALPIITEPAKKRKRFNFKGWWWKFPLGFLVALIGLSGLLESISRAGGEPGKLPTCDSDYGQQMVKDAVKNGPMSKILNVELIALKDITQRSSTEDKIVCQAKGFTNAGEQKIVFSFEWLDKAKGQFITRVAEASAW
jgi:hypothetical protein